ncbi:MAG: L-serine ammonia-lyase, iron-sulfur-dependent, subunit alpha [Clostridia bacterium]|nr:L-serine ammonia-lyase, iron-sulfur-dependent, subunit alpha [Clostridia bacterium]
MDLKLYSQYVSILKEELVPAMGCTEPIALAYAAAKARETLGRLPESCVAEVSGNIIKNVKSVCVPHTCGLKGIEAAVAAGIVGGNPNSALEVLSSIDPKTEQSILDYLKEKRICVKPADTSLALYIKITLKSDGDSASVTIENYHTNITRIERNGERVFFEQNPASCAIETKLTDRSVLSVRGILDFASSLNLADVEPVIARQIEYNTRISEAGLNEAWGAEIGRTLMKLDGGSCLTRAKAAAAAGSDARMSGCTLPVIIVSGSGNQGLTASLPVIEYAKAWDCSKDRLYRALVVSNLITIHQKTGIGRLSAYCGAVSAGCGAGAGIAFLKHGANYEIIAHTVVNAVAILSGMVCDGAKPSCAAKIAASVDAGIFGYHMYIEGHEFLDGEGIIAKGVENTIKNVGKIAQDGMCVTDREILKIMVGDS